jgi:hypothetical protein
LEIGSGLFFPDPDPNFLPIPDPGVKKAPDPGSESATLPKITAKIFIKNFKYFPNFAKKRR